MTSNRVLLIDDQESILLGLKHALLKKSLLVKTALSAEEALKILSTQTFDVVVTDFKMPGLSGLEWIKTLHLKHEGNIILASAYLTVEETIQAFRLGVKDIFQKPFDLSLFMLSLEKLSLPSKKASQTTPSPPIIPSDKTSSPLWEENTQKVSDLEKTWLWERQN